MRTSLREGTTTADKVNEILFAMRSQRGSGITWVLVEGESDAKVFSKFFNSYNSSIEVVPGGVLALERALQNLLTKTDKVLGIRDADFMHLEGEEPSIKHLFLTDCHDIEMTMLSFQSVRDNIYSEHSHFDFEENWYKILDEVAYIGYVKWLNIKYDKGLNTAGLINENIFSICDLTVKKQKFLELINKQIPIEDNKLKSEDITSFRQNFYTEDLLNLCNGHDVVKFISLIIGRPVGYQVLDKYIRLSFRLREFKQTQLYKDLHKWEYEQGLNILKVEES